MSSVMRGRNVINILLVSLVFIIIFFIFIVVIFLPAGKVYKKEHKTYTQKMYELQTTQAHHDETMDQLKELQAKNRFIILGYENIFDVYLFHKQYDRFFKSLKLSKPEPKEKEGIFGVSEIKANAILRSPADLYEFLESINKGDNIVHVQFPIQFKSIQNSVHASFTMHVFSSNFEDYLKLREVNATAKEVGADL